jgi:hypothetical protein
VSHGGGIIFTIASDLLVPQSLVEERDSYSTDNDYHFENCSVVNNTSALGGGIYVDSSSYSIPTFGPGTNIFQNRAWNFGGGVYINAYPFAQTFMINSTFEKYVKSIIYHMSN